MKSPSSIFKKNSGSFFTGVLTCLAMIGAAANALGGLIAYEGFDYTVGSQSVGRSGVVADWNGGTGWAGPWEDIPPDPNGVDPNVNPASSTDGAVSDILPGSLSYTDIVGHVLVTAGNMLHNSGTNNNATSRPARNLAFFSITNGTSTWISFLAQRTGQPSATGVYDRGANLTLFNTNVWGANNAGRLAIGESSGPPPAGQSNDTWGISPLSQGTQRRQSTIPFTNVALILIRIDNHDDNDPNTTNAVSDFDDLYFWVNPTNLAVEPPISIAVTNYLASESNNVSNPLGGIDFAFNRLVLFAGNVSGANPAAEWLIDEIRIGTTYADVVPFTGGPVIPPIFTAISQAGGGVLLSVTGSPNAMLTAEISTDLRTTNWTSLGTFTLDGTGLGTFTDTNSVATNSVRFYRAKQ
jgi:hypothetical protein